MSRLSSSLDEFERKFFQQVKAASKKRKGATFESIESLYHEVRALKYHAIGQYASPLQVKAKAPKRGPRTMENYLSKQESKSQAEKSIDFSIPPPAESQTPCVTPVELLAKITKKESHEDIFIRACSLVGRFVNEFPDPQSKLRKSYYNAVRNLNEQFQVRPKQEEDMEIDESQPSEGKWDTTTNAMAPANNSFKDIAVQAAKCGQELNELRIQRAELLQQRAMDCSQLYACRIGEIMAEEGDGIELEKMRKAITSRWQSLLRPGEPDDITAQHEEDYGSVPKLTSLVHILARFSNESIRLDAAECARAIPREPGRVTLASFGDNSIDIDNGTGIATGDRRSRKRQRRPEFEAEVEEQLDESEHEETPIASPPIPKSTVPGKAFTVKLKLNGEFLSDTLTARGPPSIVYDQVSSEAVVSSSGIPAAMKYNAFISKQIRRNHRLKLDNPPETVSHSAIAYHLQVVSERAEQRERVRVEEQSNNYVVDGENNQRYAVNIRNPYARAWWQKNEDNVSSATTFTNTNSGVLPPNEKRSFICRSMYNAEQCVVSEWMRNRFDVGRNCLFDAGDDPFSQIVPYLCSLVETREVWGPFLIVCPNHCVEDWMAELKCVAPALSVLPFWGPAKDRQSLKRFMDPKYCFTRRSPVHVVIAPFNVLQEESRPITRLHWEVVVMQGIFACQQHRDVTQMSVLNSLAAGCQQVVCLEHPVPMPQVFVNGRLNVAPPTSSNTAPNPALPLINVVGPSPMTNDIDSTPLVHTGPDIVALLNLMFPTLLHQFHPSDLSDAFAALKHAVQSELATSIVGNLRECIAPCISSTVRGQAYLLSELEKYVVCDMAVADQPILIPIPHRSRNQLDMVLRLKASLCKHKRAATLQFTDQEGCFVMHCPDCKLLRRMYLTSNELTLSKNERSVHKAVQKNKGGKSRKKSSASSSTSTTTTTAPASTTNRINRSGMSKKAMRIPPGPGISADLVSKPTSAKNKLTNNNNNNTRRTTIDKAVTFPQSTALITPLQRPVVNPRSAPRSVGHKLMSRYCDEDVVRTVTERTPLKEKLNALFLTDELMFVERYQRLLPRSAIHHEEQLTIAKTEALRHSFAIDHKKREMACRFRPHNECPAALAFLVDHRQYYPIEGLRTVIGQLHAPSTLLKGCNAEAGPRGWLMKRGANPPLRLGPIEGLSAVLRLASSLDEGVHVNLPGEVDPHHAVIVWNQREYCFELQCLSKKGVFVDGVKYDPRQSVAAKLSNGSCITVGSTSVRFVVASSEPGNKELRVGMLSLNSMVKTATYPQYSRLNADICNGHLESFSFKSFVCPAANCHHVSDSLEDFIEHYRNHFPREQQQTNVGAVAKYLLKKQASHPPVTASFFPVPHYQTLQSQTQQKAQKQTQQTASARGQYERPTNSTTAFYQRQQQQQRAAAQAAQAAQAVQAAQAASVNANQSAATPASSVSATSTAYRTQTVSQQQQQQQKENTNNALMILWSWIQQNPKKMFPSLPEFVELQKLTHIPIPDLSSWFIKAQTQRFPKESQENARQQLLIMHQHIIAHIE